MTFPIWKCPKCQSTHLTIMVVVAASLHQYGEDDFETETDGDHEWDGDSLMTCRNCDQVGPSRDFSAETET